MGKEICVNEYVRTKNGSIGKYATSGTWVFLKQGNKRIFEVIENCDITKHSFNIIDLIEEGDMLNKNEVIEVKGMGLCIYDINNENWLPIGNIDYQMGIELAIVTHEQMEGVEYKVNESIKR